MTGQTGIEHLVIGVAGRCHQRHTSQRQAVHHGGQVVTHQGNVLNAFAVELHQILFNLPTALFGLFIQRNADLAVRRGQRSGREAGVVALNVEEANFAKIEQPLVKIGPERHASAVHVVGQVVNQLQAVAHRVVVHPVDKVKVNVVDRLAVFETVNQVQRRAANAFDGRQPQLHRAGGNVDRLGTQRQRAVVGVVRVLDPKRHAAGTGPVFGGKVGRHAVGFTVDDEVDLPLAVQHHVLGPVFGHQREAHALEHRLQQARRGGRKLHKFKAHQAHRVVAYVCHGVCPLKFGVQKSPS